MVCRHGKVDAAVFGKGERYRYCIFSKSGFTQGLEELAGQGEVVLIDLADMKNKRKSNKRLSVREKTHGETLFRSLKAQMKEAILKELIYD